MNTLTKRHEMNNTEWVKKSLFKDDSIIEKAKRQKFYTISYVMDGEQKETGLWAISLEEAENKAWFKFWGCTKLKVSES